MKQRAAGIVIKDGRILLMHRRKPGEDYFVIPGGDIEKGETPEMTAVREIKEETNLDVDVDFLLFEGERSIWHNYFFVAKNIRGEAQFGGEEMGWNCEENHYELEWIGLEKISETNLLPPEIKEIIIKTFCKKDSKIIAYCDL